MRDDSDREREREHKRGSHYRLKRKVNLEKCPEIYKTDFQLII